MKLYRGIVLRTQVNQNAALSEKLYLGVVLQTRTNQNTEFSAKLYRRFILRSRTNQNVQSSMNLYRRTVPRKRTDYVQRRKTNKNAPVRNKNSQRIRLHMMWQIILTASKYLNAEEVFWTDLTCRMKQRAWRSNQQSEILHTSVPWNRLTPKAIPRNGLTE